MVKHFFALLGSLQDSHVDASNFVKCYGLHGLTFNLNLTFERRWGQITQRSFVGKETCWWSCLKVEESFFHLSQQIVDIDLVINFKDSFVIEYLCRATLAHDRLRRYSTKLRIYSHLC